MEPETTEVDPIDAMGSDEKFAAAQEEVDNQGTTAPADAPASSSTPPATEASDAPAESTTEPTTTPPQTYTVNLYGKDVTGTSEEIQAEIKKFEAGQTRNYQSWQAKEKEYLQKIEAFEAPQNQKSQGEDFEKFAESFVKKLQSNHAEQNMTSEERHQFERESKAAKNDARLDYLEKKDQAREARDTQREQEAQNQKWANDQHTRISDETDALIKDRPDLKDQPLAVQLAQTLAVNALGNGQHLPMAQALARAEAAIGPVEKAKLTLLAEQAEANKEGSLAGTSGPGAASLQDDESFDLVDPKNSDRVDALAAKALEGLSGR